MTLPEEAVAAEATLLDTAERSATQMRQTTTQHRDMTLDDAYRIQDAWRTVKLDRGEEIVGHKIGLTSRAMQAVMKIETPDSGFLTSDMVFEPNSTLEAAKFCDPKLEIELAFMLRTDLSGAEVTVDDVLDATQYVVPAVELIAARSYRTDPDTGRSRTVFDTIADNAANAGIICGGQKVGPREVDLRWVGALGYRNGVIEETGLAAAVLDHPATGIAWLCHRYATRGSGLQAGQIILAGSFTRPIDVRAGDDFRFDFGPLGEFGLQFT